MEENKNHQTENGPEIPSDNLPVQVPDPITKNDTENPNQRNDEQTNQGPYAGQNRMYQDSFENQRQSYEKANVSNNKEELDISPLSLKDWLILLLVGAIPCAGIILYIIWAFSSTGNINRRNYCRAELIIIGVVFVGYGILRILTGAVASFYYWV